MKNGKKIPQFEYSISNYGQIRNDKTGKMKKVRRHKWQVTTDIYKDGKRYTLSVPRLEACLFIRKVEKNEIVIHIDGQAMNNYYKNLEIVSKQVYLLECKFINYSVIQHITNINNKLIAYRKDQRWIQMMKH